jgi:hypothetical protein
MGAKASGQFPSHGEIGDRIMRHLHHSGGALRMQELYNRIGDEFRLSAEQRRAKRGSEPAWHYLVKQARRRLVDAGLVQRSNEPCKLTEQGRKHMDHCEDVATEGLWDD